MLLVRKAFFAPPALRPRFAPGGAAEGAKFGESQQMKEIFQLGIDRIDGDQQHENRQDGRYDEEQSL